MPPVTDTATPPPQATDLERRVLAHERILQSLIAYMARAEPRFLEHLRKTFVESTETVTREQDFTQTDDYAEEFVRAVIALGKAQRNRDRTAQAASPSETAAVPHRPAPVDRDHPDRVQVQERNGIWSVTVDGRFHGDYLRREHAEAAAALAKMQPD
jgi:hypothetical protein